VKYNMPRPSELCSKLTKWIVADLGLFP
jgi:hypothetical protein